MAGAAGRQLVRSPVTDRRKRDAGPDASERYLLRQLARAPMIAADFGDAHKKTIISLIGRGFVERLAPQHGAKLRRMIALTPAGIETLAALAAAPLKD